MKISHFKLLVWLQLLAGGIFSCPLQAGTASSESNIIAVETRAQGASAESGVIAVDTRGPYHFWASTAGLVPPNDSLEAEPFRDGAANLTKFAFNLMAIFGFIQCAFCGQTADLASDSSDFSVGVIHRLLAFTVSGPRLAPWNCRSKYP